MADAFDQLCTHMGITHTYIYKRRLHALIQPQVQWEGTGFCNVVSFFFFVFLLHPSVSESVFYYIFGMILLLLVVYWSGLGIHKRMMLMTIITITMLGTFFVVYSGIRGGDELCPFSGLYFWWLLTGCRGCFCFSLLSSTNLCWTHQGLNLFLFKFYLFSLIIQTK